MPSCHYLISGKVQGVGYRAFAQTNARSLSVTGCTRNLKDGRVEILASGEEQKLKEFEAILRQGPPHARVERVEMKVANKVADKMADKQISETDFILIQDGDKTWL